MNHRNSYFTWFGGLLSLLVLLLITSQVFGQAATDDLQTLKSLPFLELVDLKVSLTSEIAELQQVLKDLPKKIEDAQLKDRQLAQVSEQLKALTSKPTKTEVDRRDIERLTDNGNDLKAQIGDKTSEYYKAELQNKQKELDNKKSAIENVKKVLAGIYTPEQKFKLMMSIAFAILIGLVILGFFLLSYVDQAIRRAIFSGQTGIQFLTLFSLVIAIILFGITSILQDKELAALLGGLSGYILGRYNKSGEQEHVALESAPTEVAH
jgi:hypothetical protein